ncbi:MAG: UrcA family protein [Alteraurantiacibacter sp.]
MFSNTTGLATILAASALIATPALAGSADAASVSVRYSDLDLSTKDGQEALERRLTHAAEKVCGINRRTSGVALPTSESRSCYRETIESFEREIANSTQEQQQQRG